MEADVRCRFGGRKFEQFLPAPPPPTMASIFSVSEAGPKIIHRAGGEVGVLEVRGEWRRLKILVAKVGNEHSKMILTN